MTRQPFNPDAAKKRALAAKAVRLFLLTKPNGATSSEIWKATREGHRVLRFLVSRGFARLTYPNAKGRTRGEGRYFASEPSERDNNRAHYFDRLASRELAERDQYEDDNA